MIETVIDVTTVIETSIEVFNNFKFYSQYENSLNSLSTKVQRTTETLPALTITKTLPEITSTIIQSVVVDAEAVTTTSIDVKISSKVIFFVVLQNISLLPGSAHN